MIPKLRFPQYSTATDYCVYDFSDLFEFSSGKNIKQSEASKEFKIPCVRYGELYHMYSEVIDEVINRTNLDPIELRYSFGDEILLPSAGEDPLDIGSASALTLPNIAIGRTINVLRPKRINTYSHIYVSYYINEKLKRKIASLAKGVSISNVYNSDLRTLNAVLPTLSEQNKVASFLRKIDQKINLLTKKKEALETYKKGLMQKIFSQELRFKREDGTDYPEWRLERLKEVCVKENSGLSKGDLSDAGLNEVYGAAGEIEGYTNISSPSSAYVSIIKDGAGVGRVKFLQPNTSTIGTLDMIVANDSFITPYFLYILLSTIRWRKYTVGSTIPHIYFRDWKTEKVQIPSLEEQRKIVKVFSDLESKCSKILQKIEKTEMLKKGLLQQMFI